MRRKQFYWKVVSVTKGKFYSAMYQYNSRYGLRYKLNEVTNPIVGKIFVFNNRKNARAFKSDCCDGIIKTKILKCKCDNVVELHRCPVRYNTADVADFWNGHKFLHQIQTFKPPTGTFVTNSLIPVEISK